MKIHIKDQHHPQRELTVAQANLELQQGTISLQAMAWKPGLQDWVPILSLSGIQMPVPPSLSSERPPKSKLMSQQESQKIRQHEQLVSASKWNIWAILARMGIVLAYVILFLSVFSSGLHRGKNEYTAVWAGLCSIALFRRMLRMRSRFIILQKPESKAFVHYFLSYWSAFWRWLLIFISIITIGCFTVESAGDAGAFIGASIAVMIISLLCAVDIPYRVYRSYLKHQGNGFKQHHAGWVIFLFACILLLVSVLLPSPKDTKADSKPYPDSQYYVSPDRVWQVSFSKPCTITSKPLYIGSAQALRTIYSAKCSSFYCSVETVEYPQEFFGHIENISLDGARDGALSSTGGTLLSERDVYLNGVTGREISIFLKDKQIYALSRLFFKNGILYSVNTVSDKDQNPDSIHFLNSFSFR